MMNIPMIPQQVSVTRTENYGFTFTKVSTVRAYDSAMRSVFPYFIVLPSETARQFTDALGEGFSDGEYGPYLPSFSSMNTGDGSSNKVVWFSDAGLECLQRNLSGLFVLQVEPTAAKLISAREGLV